MSLMQPSIGRPALIRRFVPALSAGQREAVVVAVLCLVALGLRWPELMNVPRFTDEGDDVLPGLAIARGQALPLTSHEPYIGSLFNYLVAFGFWLLGPRLEIGRGLVMLLGALTVVPTYLLGRGLGGPAVGLLAALLLSVSGSHIVVDSHVAYSHSLTPLFATTGLWLLRRAVSIGSGWGLAGAGFTLGLAVQTHPSALAIWPGVLVYLLLQRRRLAGRWVVAAFGAALLAVLHLLVFNLTNDFSSIARAATVSDRYVRYTAFSFDGWAGRFALLVLQVGFSLGGLVSESTTPSGAFWPTALVVCPLVVLGLALLARRGEWLPGLVALSTLLGISLLSGNVVPAVVRARHYLLLLPLGFVALALALAKLRQLARQRLRRRWLADLAAVGLTAGLVSSLLWSLVGYYQHAQRDGRTNQAVLAAANAVLRAGPRDTAVYLDLALERELTLSGGTMLNNLVMIFAIRGQAVAIYDSAVGPPWNSSRPVRLVLRPESAAALAPSFRLVPLPGEPGGGARLRAVSVSARAA
jgi:dolichyl-phosphate-mannose-protein mannosyltransferase